MSWLIRMSRQHLHKIARALGEPYSIGGVEQLIGASIGIALIPEDGTSGDELLRLADLAMYEAKSSGRNVSAFSRRE